MDPQEHESLHPFTIVPGPSPALSSAAVTLAIISLFSCSFIVIALPLAATSIILALISRGDGPLLGSCRYALVTGCIALAATIGLTGYSFYLVYNNPALRHQVEQMISFYLEPETTQSQVPDSAATLPQQDADDLIYGGDYI